MCMCVCSGCVFERGGVYGRVCVCVRERERGGRGQTDRQADRQRQRETETDKQRKRQKGEHRQLSVVPIPASPGTVIRRSQSAAVIVLVQANVISGAGREHCQLAQHCVKVASLLPMELIAQICTCLLVQTNLATAQRRREVDANGLIL